MEQELPNTDRVTSGPKRLIEKSKYFVPSTVSTFSTVLSCAVLDGASTEYLYQDYYLDLKWNFSKRDPHEQSVRVLRLWNIIYVLSLLLFLLFIPGFIVQ